MILPCVDGNIAFPDVKHALKEPDGLLCFGGDLSIHRLISAYQQGIFPWYSSDEPILWWSPSERMVLFPKQLKVSKSLQKAINKHQPEFYFNRDFSTVINNCAHIPRKDRGTWIHAEMIAAYETLFHAGHAFCLEVEIGGQLVGGIYGVKTGHIYCGESMFSLQTNGSKYAMFGLCQTMEKANIKLLDCQIHNPHLAFMGAGLISRRAFKSFLSEAD
jgi:leucyl/phenylalanyl-tRNA--protein transferase